MINIYKYDGTVRAEVEPSADSYVNLQISDEHYADINFVSSAWIPFEVGDYVFLFGKYYQLLKVAAPVTKKSSVSFEYKLKFEDERQDMDDVNLMLFDNTTSDITPAYDPLHSYSKGDVVAYHTLYWECVSDTAIQGITPIEGNYWQLRSSVTHTVAEYDPTKTYTYGEEAIYNYCIFKHIGSVDTVGVHPEEGANWTQLTTAPQFDFSSVLTPHRWAQLFCDNMMRARPDQTWAVGYCIPDQPKEQAFSNVSVLSALASTADLYETEFYIEETAHRVFTINIGKKAITTSLTMKYGGDDAFSDIERNEVTDNKKVTRLVAMGGTKNILPTYRGGSKRLLLPDKMYLDSANIDPNHPLEGTHTWEDIYPSMMHATDDWDSTVAYAVGDMVVYNNTSWTCLVSNTNQAPSEGTYWQISEGTVTEFISEYKLIDKNLTFNPLDPTLIMSDGTIPKIHFITGNLAGYEFPIADFNKETKQITIQSIQDGNDSVLPTAGYTFKAGDQFNVVDFYMPQSYITKAENYLAAKATEWLQKYSVDQITYKGSVNRVWSAQNQIEIVEGDLIQVVDTDFGINIQYRITQVKRYIRENYRYEIVLDNTPYVPSKIQSIINSTEKSSTYLQYSNLDTQMAKTRTYKGASEAIDMAFDPESKYFTSGIAPLFVKTAMALFGTETQQYTLTGIKVSTSEGTPNIVSWGTGTITDTTQQSSARTWNIPSGSFTATDNNTSYYAYIRCNTESGSTVAEMIFTEKQYKLNEDSAYYYFLLGSLTKLTGSIRQFFTSSGFTFISGDSIVTGIIRSADGNTYFDLSGSHLHIGNSDKYIDYQNGEVKQKGIINVSQSGAESVIGVFRGAYQPNTMYYEGDTVTYGGSTWRYINTTAAQNITPIEGDNWTNVSAAGKGISSTVITYQVSDSGTTAPTGTWLTSIPSVPAGSYLWTRTVITYTDGQTSTGYTVSYQSTNGVNSYFHTAYSTAADGSTGFSTTDPTGKTYIGTYSDSNEADSTDHTKYTWVLIKGETGATGATGNGISSYSVTYQKSASGTDIPTGSWTTSIPSLAAGEYLWTKTTLVFADSASTSAYSVSMKGETGETGATGTGIDSIIEEYYLSTSKTEQIGGSWITEPPAWVNGEYIWTRSKITYSNPTSIGYTTPIVSSEWEAVDNIQIGGTNLISNGDFHNNTTYYGSNGYTSFSRLTSNLPNGFSYGGEFVVPSANHGFYIYLSNVYGSSFVFEHGQVYTISLYAKANDTVNMNYGMENVFESIITLSTSWQRFSYQVTGDGYNRAIVFYPLAACTLDITGIQLELGNKVTSWSPAPEDVQSQIDETIANVDVEYYLSTSNTSLLGGSWVTTAPVWVDGKFMWSRTKTTKSDGTVTYTPSEEGTCIAGATGKTGKGISSTAIGYQLSTSGTTAPTGTWLSSIPSVPAGEYLWTRTIITYTDSATSTSYTVGMMGEKGTTGADGTDGTNGVGIASTSVTYQASSSGTVAPTGTWSTSIPSVSASQYLWTKTVWTYTDKTTATGYSVGKMGDDGTPGATGNYFEHRYAVNGSNSTPPSLDTSSVSPSGWTTSLPTQGLLEYTWMTTAEKTAAGALVGTWSTPIRVTGIKGDTGEAGAAGATGPSMSFSGDWSASNTYTGSSIIVQVVKYSGTYYITRSDAGGSFSSSTTPNNDTAHWNVYGSSFDNIATGLLLAQEAFIENLIVSQLATSANPYHMLLAILDSSLGIFRNKADSASIGNAIVAIGKDISEMQLSGQRKPAIAVRDVQWRGDYDGSTIYYKDDRVYYATNNTTYLFTHDWAPTETPVAGLLPTNNTYWESLGSGNLGGGKYSELGSEGIFSNGSNVQGLPFLGTDDNFTLAALLQKRNADSYGISAAVLGVDETQDSNTINTSKSYGGYFNRLFIQSELDNIFVTSDSANMTLDKSGYHTIHYYGSSDKNVYLPAVNSRDVGLKFWFRKMNGGNIIVHADSGHDIIDKDNNSVSFITVEYGSKEIFIWDGSHWVFNYMN